MLEDWLINPRIDKDDCLMHARMGMFNDCIAREKMESQDIEIPYSLGMIVDEKRYPKYMRMQQVVTSRKKTKYKHGKKMFQPKDRLDIEIEQNPILA